ncbi:GNAT family N-acetyltransferase [Nesterenkonia alkaliphila]|uniref:GNAT family N-acetyltransferase n=1 Tax=Nesterenkonia alkaliphila TaxID=1463631 RepID=A0A7K1UHJ8_9MICC|nr:GNAT family N-acetyltransferase [Nesterenkonia alkaliphila]MVT25864.1 GNAT family N-acetyltransferase [Nesterenkonia alkaliphila]GFZ76546.1 N-acetyltransferase [Nesterenkonia alkaliphila]
MSTTTPETTSTAQIRPAQEADFGRIGELTVAAYLEGGHLGPQDTYLQHLTEVADRAAKARLLVAEVDGVVAGSATVTDFDGAYAEVALPGEMEFRMLAVAPEFQGRGVARALVRHIMAEAQSRPEILGVALCSLRSMTAAHALYESEGFVRDPRRDFVLNIPQKQATFPFFRREV